MSEEEQTVPLSQVESRVKEIFGGNRKVTTNIVSLLVGNKPIGYRGKSIAPYYKPHYGEAMKAVFDSMVQAAKEGKPTSKIFLYTDFCKNNNKKTTLYSKVYYGIRYLVECMDDAQRTYSRLANLIDINRTNPRGIVLEFSIGYDGGEIPDATVFIPTPVVPLKETPKWKEELERWLEEGAVGSTFHSAGLLISNEELVELKQSLLPLKNILASVTAKEIKLIKINPDNI